MKLCFSEPFQLKAKIAGHSTYDVHRGNPRKRCNVKIFFSFICQENFPALLCCTPMPSALRLHRYLTLLYSYTPPPHLPDSSVLLYPSTPPTKVPDSAVHLYPSTPPTYLTLLYSYTPPFRLRHQVGRRNQLSDLLDR